MDVFVLSIHDAFTSFLRSWTGARPRWFGTERPSYENGAYPHSLHDGNCRFTAYP